VKQRLSCEAPFTFLEFNYIILQAYEFLKLHHRIGTVSIGWGDDGAWSQMPC